MVHIETQVSKEPATCLLLIYVMNGEWVVPELMSHSLPTHLATLCLLVAGEVCGEPAPLKGFPCEEHPFAANPPEL